NPNSGCRVRTADHIELWSLEVPTQHHDVSEALRVISVHVRKENCIQLWRGHVDLREPHVRTAAGIELQFCGAAIVAVVTVTHKGSRASLTVENRGPPLGARH